VGPKNQVLDGVQIPHERGTFGVHVPANITYLHISALPSVCLPVWANGRMHLPLQGVTRWRDAASCQITSDTFATT